MVELAWIASGLGLGWIAHRAAPHEGACVDCMLGLAGGGAGGLIGAHLMGADAASLACAALGGVVVLASQRAVAAAR